MKAKAKPTLAQLNNERNRLCSRRESIEKLRGVYAAEIKALDAKIEALKVTKAMREDLIRTGEQKLKDCDARIMELAEKIATYK